MVAVLPDTLAGHRDACLILVGFSAALRRSELVALDVEAVEQTDDGLIVTIRRPKTDQDGERRPVGVPWGSDLRTCPVRAFRRYVARSQLTRGPLFRAVDRHGNLAGARLSDKAVALIVKRAAGAVGLDPAKVAGHSLRSGMATSAARAGASEGVDHGGDWSCQPSGIAPVHPAWDAVHRQCIGKAWPLMGPCPITPHPSSRAIGPPSPRGARRPRRLPTC